MKLWTLGHSTHSIEEFLELLRAHGIRQLVDIRTLPGSRRHPQFNQENLEASLGAANIKYRHMKGLGGLRKPKADSINTGWKNSGFRGYADYMQTAEFEEQLKRLLEWSEELPTAVMCAEALPWKCHRSLLADALDAHKVEVRHIMSKTQATPHHRTKFAKVKKGKLSYPPATQEQLKML
jgi:Uncharacterized conserved protein